MKSIIRSLVFFSFVVLAAGAAQADDYSYQWQCNFESCTFIANPVAGVASYDWKFGDGTYGSGQAVSHDYDFPGSGFQTTRVTLTYHLTNGTYRSVRCYIQWFETTAGGDPTDYTFSGTCSSFN